MKRYLDGKTVRFIAVGKKYARVPYPLIAPMSDKMNTYVTGQHVEPGNPETTGNLTIPEMTGAKALTTQKANRFMYVINPDNPTQIFHLKTYDCSVDDSGKPVHPKEYWEANFIFLQEWVVAKNKEAVKPGKHHFYLDDPEAAAHTRVKLADRRYEAEKLIREKLALEDYKLMVFVLNMRIPDFYHEPATMNDTQLKDVLLQQAELNPQHVEYYFSDEAKPFLLGAELYGAGIITKRHDGYYFEGQFLAAGAAELARYLDDDHNANISDKLKTMLRESKNKKVKKD